jgi:hypothetical protein
VRHYTFTPEEIEIIGEKHGESNRPGPIIQIAMLRFPGNP